MDKDQIINTITTARLENWPCSMVLERFIKAGVEFYEVALDTFEVTYFGSQQVWRNALNLNLLPLKIKNTLSIGKLTETWDRHQKGKTSFTMFIHAAASAGVKSYCVDIYDKTINFHGVDPTKQHCESIS